VNERRIAARAMRWPSDAAAQPKRAMQANRSGIGLMDIASLDPIDQETS
jgi:hypothetical protein